MSPTKDKEEGVRFFELILIYLGMVFPFISGVLLIVWISSLTIEEYREFLEYLNKKFPMRVELLSANNFVSIQSEMRDMD